MGMQYNSNEIAQILPHRYPFALVDRIVDGEPGQWAKGIKCVSVGEPVFCGHFPQEHVLPGVLILDDTTSAVDLETERAIQEELRSLDFSCTKIIIAQRISSIQDADLILVLDGGAINGMGTHETLLSSNQIYQEVYYSQNRTGGADNG